MDNLNCYIPGKGGLPHMTFDLSGLSASEKSNLQVLAGHFDWDIVEDEEMAEVVSEQRTVAQCFTMLRHPVDRAISFFYERVYPVVKKTISAYAETEDGPALLDLLIRGFVGTAQGLLRDEGMSDTLTRQLSSASYRRGMTPDDAARHNLNSQVLTDQHFIKARANFRLCIVGVVENMTASHRVLAHWFPWIGDIGQNTTARTLRKNQGYVDKETVATLPHVVRQNIEEHNKYDLQMYHEGLEMFQNQLAEIAKASGGR
jgi:hypothetical protein